MNVVVNHMKWITPKLPELGFCGRVWKPPLVMLSIALLLILSPFRIHEVHAQGMKQVIIGGYNGALSNVGVRYNAIAGGYTWTSTASASKQVVSTSGTLKNLFIELSGAPGSGTSYIFTVLKNDTPTSLSVTITDPATTGSDTTNSVAVVAGDVIQLQSAAVGVAATPTARWSVMFEGSYAKQSLILGLGECNTAATIYHPISHANPSGSTTNQYQYQIIPTSGVIKNLYVALSTDPGTSPDAYRFTLRKNASSTALTVTITADNTTGNDTTNTVSVAAGDRVDLMIEPLNVPSATPVAWWGMTFVADTDGESLILGGSYDAPTVGSTEYHNLSTTGESVVWGATESSFRQGGQSGATLKKLYVRLSGASSGAYTLYIRANGANTPITVTIPAASTTGNDTTHTYNTGNYDDLDISCNALGTAQMVWWGLVCYTGPSPTQVYYSVGQNTNDHKTGGSPTVSISNGTATFSVAQTATNMGVGDCVTYNSSNYAYISGKISTTQWTVVTATGGTPADVSGATVNSIAHAFGSLNAAVGDATFPPGAANGSHLTTTDLVTGNYVLNIPCYYDSGPDTVSTSISDWTTGVKNYIKIYTPMKTSTECNQSQRHSGKWDTSKYRIEAPTSHGIFSYNAAEHVRIDGIQIWVNQIVGYGNACIGAYTVTTGAADYRFSNNICRGPSIDNDTNDYYGISIYDTGGTGSVVRIWNNIVYGFVRTNAAGIYIGDAEFTGYVYNNTVYNCRRGFYRSAGTFVAKNNISMCDVVNSAFTDFSGTFSSASTHNYSSDTTAPDNSGANPSYENKTLADVDFVSTASGSEDFHLQATSDAIGVGKDLFSDPNLAFSDDIDGQGRGFGSAWDIGADEYVDGKFEYKRKITIDHTKVSPCSSNLSHFPILINTTNWLQADKDKLKTVANSGHVYRSDGGDIIFRGSDEVTQLDHEIENFDGASGILVAWVRIPTVSYTLPDTYIYMYYGNAAITSSTQNVTGVWSENGNNNFKGVWHLKETSGPHFDSTTNAHSSDSISVNTQGTASGVAGGADNFSASNQHVRFPDSSDWDLTANFTVEAWVKGADNDANYQSVVGRNNNNNDDWDYALVASAGGDSANPSFYNDVIAILSSSVDVKNNDWTYLVIAWNGTNRRIYVDGVQRGIDAITPGVENNSKPLYIGDSELGTLEGYVGIVDEVRISNTYRDACWIGTTYNNMYNQSTFYNLGSEGAAAPTFVKLKSFIATEYSGGVLLEWRTGHEVNNLGFHIYREENGQLIRLTPEPVAGSALMAGSRTALTAGHHYHWWDLSALDTRSSALATPKYWLKDIDLNGTHTMHGPVTPVFSREPIPDKQKPELLSERGMRLRERYQHYWKVRDLKERLDRRPSAIRHRSSAIGVSSNLKAAGRTSNLKPLRLSPQSSAPDTVVQQYLAGKSAVKLFVKEEGWYRVTQSELGAAGLSSKVNPQFLQLYTDGREQPIHVIGGKDGRFGPGDVIEFYGIGLDTPSTDTRVYWLIEGAQPGKRIDNHIFNPQFRNPHSAIPNSFASFPYVVQVKDRWIYLPAIKNGEEENFFGAVVYGAGVDQLLEVKHLDLASSEDAWLEVALQGATTVSHRVKVLLNKEEVGEVVFEGQSKGLLQVEVPQSLLLEGDNLVSFIPLGGEMDVSLVDSIRLTYWHTYTADNDGLRFTAQGGSHLALGGFSSSRVRVFDITDPGDVIEVLGKVESQKGSYAVSFRVPGTEQTTLLALTEEKIKTPEGIDSNRPSVWHQVKEGYDLVIVTHRDFLDSLQPLKKLRESQGLRVALIDVEDLYDEFSFGNKSPKVIKDFLASAKSNWRKTPRFVLLVGDASLDPKNYFGLGDLDFVPTKLIDTVYMETASDDWFVDLNNDGLPEIAIGRIPVRTAEEASVVVSKIIGYERSGKKNEALLVADRMDNSDDYDFEGASEELRGLLPSSLMVRKIYRSQFSSDSQVNGALLSAINQGPLLVNFVGHGSIEIWRGNIFTSEDAEALINGYKLPFFVNMTCLNGYFQDPYSETLGEALIKAKGGGAVAVWNSSGLTEPDRQAVMNKELIRLLFSKKEILTLGEATARAKASISDQDIRKTWILFGDPTTRLK